MRVTFLGTGSAMPVGDRVQTGLLLEPGESDRTDGENGDDGDDGDDTLLVDCGSGILHQLARTDVGYEGVDTVLLTHHHLDHVSDLMPLLKARWLAGEEELTIAGPDDTQGLVEDLLDVHEYMQDRIDITFRDVEPGSFSVAGFDVEAVETVHSMYCLAYRFERDGVAFTFSGDSEATEPVADLAAGSAVLAHDCSFPDGIDVSNHPTPSSLGEALAGRDLGRLYLTHLYPHTNGEHGQMIETVEGKVDCDVTVARDGLSIEVS